MGDGDRREFLADRRRPIGQREIGKVGGEGLRLRRYGEDAPRTAPGLEGRSIARIAAAGAFGERAFSVGARGVQRVGERHVAKL